MSLMLSAVRRAGRRPLDVPVVDMNAADPGFQPVGIDLDLVSGADLAPENRPGDDRAEPVQDEHPVDGHPEYSPVLALGHEAALLPDRRFQAVEAGAGERRDRDDRSAGHERAHEERFDLALERRQPAGVDEVALGQRDDAARNVEELEDIEVLARLDADTLVGGDDEQGEVDVARARDHRLDEFLVAGNVDEDDLLVVAGRVHEDEPELDGQAALLFLGQGVGVDAGERLDEGRFTVVDVARRPDDQVLFFGSRHGRAQAEGLFLTMIFPGDLATIRPISTAARTPRRRRRLRSAAAAASRTAMRSPPEVCGS